MAKEESNVLELPLDRDTKEVKLKGSGNKVKEYVLTELDGTARDDYLAEMGNRMKTVDGQTEIRNYKGLQATLIVMCMTDKCSGEAISLDEVQALPGKTLTALFKACQDLNGLGDDAVKTKAKNG